MTVVGLYREYFASIWARISRSGLPCLPSSITSRVMLRQSVQVAPWLVYVTVPSRFSLLM